MTENIENILKKTYSLLKEIYNTKEKKEEILPCYICLLLKEQNKKTISAHSISRGNNFKGRKWYTWDISLQNRGQSLIHNEKLILFSDTELSVTHSICGLHDKHFAEIFENTAQGKAVDYFNAHHLILLNLRTFINFDLRLNKENIQLNKIYSIVLKEKNKYQLNFNEEKYLKNVLSEIKEKELMNKSFYESEKFKFLLERNVKKFWNKTYTEANSKRMGVIYIYPLYREITTLIIPLKNESNIVGSFFIDYKNISKDMLGNMHTLTKTLLSTENFYIYKDIYLSYKIELINQIQKQWTEINQTKNYSIFLSTLKEIKQKYHTDFSKKTVNEKYNQSLKECLKIINTIQKQWESLFANKKQTEFNFFLINFKKTYEDLLFNNRLKSAQERILRYRKKIPYKALEQWEKLTKDNKKRYKNNISIFLDKINRNYDSSTIEQKLKKYSKEHLISINILNNGDDPAIIIQCEDEPYSNIFLHNLFLYLKENDKKFLDFLIPQIIKNDNIYFSQDFIDSLTNEDKRNLQDSHNNKKTYLKNNLFKKIANNLEIDYPNVCFYLQGRPYQSGLKSETFDVTFNVLKILNEALHNTVYIEVTLGNYYTYSAYIDLDYNNYIIKMDSENDELTSLIYKADSISEFWQGIFNDGKISKEKMNENIISEINQNFNSSLGYKYYIYFNDIPNKIENLSSEKKDILSITELESYLIKRLNEKT